MDLDLGVWVFWGPIEYYVRAAFNREAIGRYTDLAKEGHVQVRLAKSSERAVAVDLLVREWGDPVVVRSQIYPIDSCDIFIAGDMEGIAAVSGRDRPIAELVAINAFVAIKELAQHSFDRL